MPDVPRDPGPPQRVSVALCTHDGAAHVAEQVRSILAQRPAPSEIVIGDDDSTDATVEIIMGVVAEMRDAHPELPTDIRIIRRAPALGVVANFAATLAACTGDAIALSDQDDVWPAGRLETLLEALHADAEILLVHSDARLIDAGGEPIGYTLLSALEATAEERAGLRRGEAFPVLLRRNLVTGATVVIRRRLLDLALPFPPDWVHDEWLAAIAAAAGGLRLLPEPLTDYRQHGANQIGARRSTLADKWARLREPRAERAARLERRARHLVERLDVLAAQGLVPPMRAEQARAKHDHESRRARLPRSPLARVPGVLGGVLAHRYGRYSRGSIDVLRDLVQPAGQPSAEDRR